MSFSNSLVLSLGALRKAGRQVSLAAITFPFGLPQDETLQLALFSLLFLSDPMTYKSNKIKQKCEIIKNPYKTYWAK